MPDTTKLTRNLWVSLDDLMVEHLTNLLEDIVENHAKNLRAIDRVIDLLDASSEERTRLTKMSNDEYEKLMIYNKILKQVQLADASTYIIKPEPGAKLKLSV